MKIYKTWDLPRWAKTKQRIQDSRTWEKTFVILEFGWMDWAYWKWYTPNWDIVNFNAEFAKVKWLYVIVDTNE